MQIVAPCGVELLEQLHHGIAVLGVEVSRRLVGEQDQRITCDRAGDRDALLLAARELARQVARAVRHPHRVERGRDLRSCAPPARQPR